jgi:predicted chitinase
MAEVTGDFGGQPIQLNNAATEATLKQLLAAMLASVAQQGKNTKKDTKIQQDLEAELRKIAKGAQDFKKTQEDAAAATKANTAKTEEDTETKKKNTKATADAKKAQEEYKKSLEETAAMYGKLNAALENGIGYINKVTSSFTNMGSSVTAAAASLSAIPVVGNMLAGVFGTVAGAAEKSYKAFQQSASVGANFGGSINDMIRSSTDAGLTFDQFSGVIAKNGEALALLGGSTRDGAKRLAELGKRIKETPLMGELAGLGYSTEEVNSGMARYSGMLAKTGQLQGKNNDQLVAGSADYLKNLDQLSRLTGQSKDALKANQDALYADAQYRARLQDMDEPGQKRLDKLMLSLPASLQKGAKEFIAFGGATTDAGREFATFMQSSAGASNAAFREIEQSGTLSQKGADAIYSAVKADADALRKSGTGKLIANIGNGAQQAIALDAMNLSARKTTLSEVQVQQEKELEAQKERTKQAQEGMNPQAMLKFQQMIAETSNKFTEIVGNQLPKLQTAFESLSGFVKDYVLPAFSLIAKHIEIVVAGMIALKVAQLAYKAAMFVEKMKEGRKPSGNPGDPIRVKDDSPGGRDSGGGRDKGGKKGGGMKGAGGLVKGVAVLGAVTALVGLYDDIKDVNKEVDSGDITEREGTVKKGEAVGAAAGTAGGAWAGAAAGAAIGSVVPVVGTVVGGLIGGAIGGWLGKTGGAMIGSSVTEAVTELSMDDLKKDKNLYKKYLDRYNESLTRNLKLGKSKEEADKLAIAEANKALNVKKEEIKVTKDKIEADAKAADAANTAAAKPAEPAPELDFTDPQKLFDSFKKRQDALSGQPQVAPPAGTVPAAVVPPGGAVATPPPLKQDQTKNMELIKAALQKQGITDPKYIAATLGNVMKETGGQSKSENLDYSKTSNDRIKSIFGSRAAGKTDQELNQIKSDPKQMGEMMYGSTTKMGQQMGNSEPGDGWKYRGRGFIQLTGKSNYAQASKAIYGDDRLVQNPDLVNDPAVAAEVSAWYMKKGKSAMAAKMGIDEKNMSQGDANLLATSQIAGGDVRKKGSYLAGEVMNKVTAYSGQMAGIAGAPTSAEATTVLASNKNLSAQDEAKRKQALVASQAQSPLSVKAIQDNMAKGMSQADAQKAEEQRILAKENMAKEAMAAMAARDSVKAQPTDKNKTASSALAQPVGQQNTPGNNNYDFGMSVAIAGQTFQASVLKSSQIIESTFGKFGSPFDKTKLASPDASTATATVSKDTTKALIEKMFADSQTQLSQLQTGKDSKTSDIESKPGPGTGAPGAGGVSTLNEVVASLEMLNKQIGQLIGISRTTADLNESQLRVQKNMGGDMFLSA